MNRRAPRAPGTTPVPAWSVSRRALLALLLFIALGGPTPGSIGSCSDDIEVTDAQSFCIDTQALYCLRDFEAERIDEAAYDECLADVAPNCRGFAWNPAVCPIPPTEQRANACIAALRSKERLETPNDEILECKSDLLCERDL